MEAILNLIPRLFDLLPGWKEARARAERDRRVTEEFRRGTNAAFERLENEPGWRPWCSCPPPRHELVEVMSGLTGNSYELVPSQMSPEANVYHLYWREVGQMRRSVAEKSDQRYLH